MGPFPPFSEVLSFSLSLWFGCEALQVVVSVVVLT